MPFPSGYKKRAADGGVRGVISQHGGSSGGDDRTVESLRLMSGVEEGGGEPSSGKTPDKKSFGGVNRRSPRGLFSTLPTPSLAGDWRNNSPAQTGIKLKK